MSVSNRAILAVLVVALLACSACQHLLAGDTQSLLSPRLQKSEVWGFVAGFGTTFAAVPDVVAMVRKRSSAGVNPRMAGILALFQLTWIYYGFLIASRPVIAWNTMAVIINTLSVMTALYFARR